MAFAIRRSIIVSGMDLFANRAKLSLFFSPMRMLSATMLDAVPIGVAIPPIPVPTANAQANRAIESPARLDIAPITGMKTVTRGTLATVRLSRPVLQRQRLAATAHLPRH